MRLKDRVLLATFVALLFTVGSAFADTFVTATVRPPSGLGYIVKVDLSAPASATPCTVPAGSASCTVLLQTPQPVDSLYLYSPTQFIYTLTNGGSDSLGQALLYDTTQPLGPNNPQVLADNTSGGIDFPEDIIVSPDRSTLYTSNFSGNTLTKTNLAGPFPNGTTCQIHTAMGVIGGPEGLAFDNMGRLFVLAGWGTTAAGIYQIDPTSCLVLNSKTGFDPNNEPDGLTYDPSTNRLFATSSGIGGSNEVYSIDPNSLIAVPIASVPSPDGIINDLHGTLYVASRSGAGVGEVYSIDESTLVTTPLTLVPYVDDLGIIPPGPPVGTKTISPGNVPPGGNSTVMITLTNPNSVTNLTTVGFTDTLPPGVVVATPPAASTTCPGATFVPVAGASSVTFTMPTLAPGAPCTATFNITDNNAVNTVSTNCVTATSTNAGPDAGPITVAGGRCATVTTAMIPALGSNKGFGTPPVPSGTMINVGQNTLMTITISNGVGDPAVTGVNFTDDFTTTAPGLTVASPVSGTTNTCGGTFTPVAGATTLSLTGGSLATGPSSCTLTVNVTGTLTGLQTNNITVNGTGVTSAMSTATLTVNPMPMVPGPPVITKAFNPSTIPVFTNSTLTFLITNPDLTPPLTLNNIAFTDTLPVGLVIATPNNLAGSCGGGTITALAGTNSISLSGATLAGGGSCTFSVDVTAILAGAQINTTSTITTTTPVTPTFGSPATATLNVDPPYDSYQINYLPNVQTGGVVDISNAGGLGADPFGPGSGTTGRICANIYTFAPDEQEVSCCSCLVTPNALVNVTAADLVGNTATGVQPSSVVVKILFTVPGASRSVPGTQAGPYTASTCNAATPFNFTNLAPGGRAWATKFHSPNNPPAASYSLTETEFIYNPITVGALTQNTIGDIVMMTNLCQFISGNQSGAGICASCALGGIGGAKQ